MFSTAHYQFYDQRPDLVFQNGKVQYFQVYLELDWTHYKDFFGKGTYLGLYWEKNTFWSDVKHHIIGLKVEQFFSPYKEHNFYLASYFFSMLEKQKYFEERIGQDATSYSGPLRGYEKNQILATQGLSFSFEYRVPLLEIFSTTLVISPFLDGALVSFSKKDFHYTFGLAGRFYFKQILIPAIQFYVGYGPKYNNSSLGFIIGTRL